jgi:hypothetical protein
MGSRRRSGVEAIATCEADMKMNVTIKKVRLKQAPRSLAAYCAQIASTCRQYTSEINFPIDKSRNDEDSLSRLLVQIIRVFVIARPI